MAFLLAAVLTAVGYASLFASNETAIPTAVAPHLTPAEEPPSVEGLSPMKPWGGWVAAALERDGARRSGTASVEIRGPAAGAEGGVGILDGESSACLWWIELSGRELPVTLELPGIPTGDHWLVAARHRGIAHSSYSNRSELRIHADGDAVAGAAVVDVSVHAVMLHVEWPDLSRPVPPFVHANVRRVTDPAWCYRPLTSAREQFRGDPARSIDHRNFAFEGLGPGTYQLELERADVVPEDAARLTFTLPGPDKLIVRCRPH